MKNGQLAAIKIMDVTEVSRPVAPPVLRLHFIFSSARLLKGKGRKNSLGSRRA